MCLIVLIDIILSCQISETLVLKFSVITPESLDMSRMIMSVISAAMGSEQQGSGGGGVGGDSGGSASLVSNTLYSDKAGHVISFYCAVTHSYLGTDLHAYECTGFCPCALSIFRSERGNKSYFPLILKQ